MRAVPRRSMAPPRRVPPPAPPPTARAWLDTDHPLEHCGLLEVNIEAYSPVKVHHKNISLQSGLTLTATPSAKKYIECPKSGKLDEKSKFQRRKEKLITFLKPPHFILSMIIIMVIVHVLDTEVVGRQQVAAAGGALGALEWLGSDATWWRHPWRIFSYSLLHASASHLAINALVALAVGWRLEIEQGWWRVAVVWWGGAAAGALAAGALQPTMNVVGASAAVYALLTAHLPNVCLRFGYIPLWWFRPLSVAVLGASEACWAAAARPLRPHEARQAWSSHALGAAVGVPLAFLVFTGENVKRRWIVSARALGAAILAVGVVLCALHYAGPLLLDSRSN